MEAEGAENVLLAIELVALKIRSGSYLPVGGGEETFLKGSPESLTRTVTVLPPKVTGTVLYPSVEAGWSSAWRSWPVATKMTAARRIDKMMGRELIAKVDTGPWLLLQ